MRCYRIELARYLEDGTNEHQVTFEADELAADAVYRMLRDSQPGDDERTRGVFIDALVIETSEDLASLLRQDAQISRHDLQGVKLAQVARTAEAF